MTSPIIVALGIGATHGFSKRRVESVRLVAGAGVAGDAHCGATVMHRSRVAQDPTQPNLRQVHLIHAELHDELRDKGFAVEACDLGENVTTRGIDLLDLPTGTRLLLGTEAVVELTGLRNPCAQIERFRTGLLAAVLDRDQAGGLVRKSGVMGIVLSSGAVRVGDAIAVALPPPPHVRLERV